MITKLKALLNNVAKMLAGSKAQLVAVAVIVALALSLAVLVMHGIQARHDAQVDKILDRSEEKVSELEGRSSAHEAEAQRLGDENVKLKAQLEQLARTSAEAKVRIQTGEREIQRVKDKIDSNLANFSVPADILEQCERACASAKQLGYIDQASPCDCRR